MFPLVSILIPVYNTEMYLQTCLDSIINQTYPSLQVVIVDDGSKDGSLRVAREYAERFPFIEVYHQENAGVATARNALLTHAKGEYVLFVDSDDWIEHDMIAFLQGKADEYQADIVTCGMVVNDNPVNWKYSAIELWEQDEAIREFLRHVSFNGSLWNKLVKTSLLHNLKFHCGISYGEDALFTWYVLQRVKRVLVTDKELYHYRMNDESISHTKWSPEKKGTDHIVWATIASDTAKWWPQYLHIANARYALQDMWALFYASLSGYKYDNHIRIRQLNIKNNLGNIRRAHLINTTKYLFTCTICRWYWVGRILRTLRH